VTKTLSIDYKNPDEAVYIVESIKETSPFPLKESPTVDNGTIHEHDQVFKTNEYKIFISNFIICFVTTFSFHLLWRGTG